jgi:GT2 family glycosyltransferase
MKPIDIVITCWQREQMTANCLDALRLNTRYPYRIILIDNGSQSSFAQNWMKQCDIYVKLDRNYGLEHAKHIGMSFVESDLFISSDNDILVYNYEGKDWLERMVDLMNKYPEYGAIGCRPQILVGTGNIFAGKEEQEIVDFGHVPGYMRIMRTAWTNEVGAWQDKRPLRGHEELWIGQKFSEKGYKLGWANNVKCWHLFGEEDTDPWGYLKGMAPEEHGHNPVWPMPKNDRDEIKDNVGLII